MQLRLIELPAVVLKTIHHSRQAGSHPVRPVSAQQQCLCLSRDEQPKCVCTLRWDSTSGIASVCTAVSLSCSNIR